MKRFGLALAISLAFSAFAAHAQVKNANHYVLKGSGIHVTYDTTGIDGKPHLTLQEGGKTNSFSGDAIRTSKNDLGTVVSVTTIMTVDSGSTSLSILIPDVALTTAAPLVEVTTYAITTTHHFGIGPAFNRGQKETYQVVMLKGPANSVLF